MSKHIIIIGGMGPQASLYAHERLLKLSQRNTTTSANESYPRITHLSINVEDFISDPKRKDIAKQYILLCLKDVDFDSVDTGFIACNTAHLLFDDIQEAVGNKIISLIDVTRRNINSQRIGIVATPSTLDQNLYGNGIALLPDNDSRRNIELIIRQVISGVPVDRLVSSLKIEIEKLKKRGAEKVILGCSELSMFYKYLDPESIIDPIELTINEII